MTTHGNFLVIRQKVCESDLVIAILGGSGLVGKELIHRLQGREEIIVFSRKSVQGPGVTWIEWSGAEIPISEVAEGVTCLVHLANTVAPSSWDEAAQVRAFLRNAVTNLNVLQMCASLCIPKLIWISSATGYGIGVECSEEMFGIGELPSRSAGTGAMVRSFEAQLKGLAALRSMDVRVLRPTTIIGPNDPSKNPPVHAVSKLIWSQVCGQESKIYLPEVPRDYIFASDVAEIIKTEIGMPTEKGVFEAYNIGSGRYSSLSEITELVASQLGERGGATRRVLADALPTVTVLPLEKGIARYGSERRPLKEGIIEMVSAYSSLAQRN